MTAAGYRCPGNHVIPPQERALVQAWWDLVPGRRDSTGKLDPRSVHGSTWKCVSVGWLVVDNERWCVLARRQQDAEPYVAVLEHIPRNAVTRLAAVPGALAGAQTAREAAPWPVLQAWWNDIPGLPWPGCPPDLAAPCRHCGQRSRMTLPCSDTGWLIDEKEHWYILANGRRADKPWVMGVSRVPKCAVTRVAYLDGTPEGHE